MKDLIETIVALIFTITMFAGGGYAIKEVHDFVRYETLKTVSKGLSSSGELARALTKRK